MARRPFYVRARHAWYFKHKPHPTGKWVKVKLCDHSGAVAEGVDPRPPRKAELRAAELVQAEFRARHRIGPAPAPPRALGAYLDAYAESHSLGNTPGSTKHVRRGVARFKEFAAGLGVATIQEVTRATCRDYLEMRSRRVRASTLRTERGYLMGAWARAVEDELIAANPWLQARVQGRAGASPPTFWDGPEVARIAAACTRGWQRDLVLLMANTGLRIQTALAARWDWVDGPVLQIRQAPNVKTVYAHVLGATAREILGRRRAEAGDSPLVFPREGGDGPYHYTTARDAIDRAIRKAGVRPGTPHDLRHSYGRGLATRGVPVTVIQRQLGHASLAMTMRYVSADAEGIGRFVEEIDLGS